MRVVVEATIKVVVRIERDARPSPSGRLPMDMVPPNPSDDEINDGHRLAWERRHIQAPWAA